MNEFYNEIEHYMGIPMLASKTKQELNTIILQSTETVNKYYYQIFKLWQQVNTPDDQRIEKFKLTLKPSISTPLLIAKHNSLRKFFNADASAAAASNKGFRPWRNLTTIPATPAANNTATMMIANVSARDRPGNSFNLNARFIPTATKS